MDNTANNTFDYTDKRSFDVYRDTQNMPIVSAVERQNSVGRSNTMKTIVERIIWRMNPEMAAKLAAEAFMRPRCNANYMHTLPDGAERISVIYNLRKLAGYAWGNPCAETVLLVHDWHSNLGSMMHMVEPLVKSGYRVVAFDAPGHGQSPAQQTHMIAYGEAIRAAMEQFEVKRLVAHGIGATAALVMLARVAEMRAQLQQIVLLAPISSMHEQVEAFARGRGLRYKQMKRLRMEIERRLSLSIGVCDAVYAAGMMSLPGLIIHDEDDHVAHFSAGLRIAAGWYNAIFEVTSGISHDDMLHNEDIIDSIIDFLVPHRQLTTETSEAPVVF